MASAPPTPATAPDPDCPAAAPVLCAPPPGAPPVAAPAAPPLPALPAEPGAPAAAGVEQPAVGQGATRPPEESANVAMPRAPSKHHRARGFSRRRMRAPESVERVQVGIERGPGIPQCYIVSPYRVHAATLPLRIAGVPLAKCEKLGVMPNTRDDSRRGHARRWPCCVRPGFVRYS